MRRNTDKAHRIWQMIYRAGREGIPTDRLRRELNTSKGALLGVLATLEQYDTMLICEESGRLFALCNLDEPQKDMEIIKDKNYYFNRYGEYHGEIAKTSFKGRRPIKTNGKVS